MALDVNLKASLVLPAVCAPMTMVSGPALVREACRSGIMGAVLASQPVTGKPQRKLLDQVRDVMRLKHYSLRTERAYCDWITRFIRFHQMRHPAEMREPEMSEFLTHLARSENVSAATQNQALSALLFLYKQVLKEEIG